MEPVSQKIDLKKRAFVTMLPSYLLDNLRSALTNIAGFKKSVELQVEQDVLTLPRVARINVERCLAWGNSLCQACYLACPLRDTAIDIVDQKPIINISKCDGCGFCVSACSTVNDQNAIELVRGGE